jgi:predicted amino acid racemase
MSTEVQDILSSIEKKVNDSDSYESKVNEFLINRDEEETKMTLEYARALLSLEVDIKEIKDDQKEIKAEAKANGVSVMKVNKVLANMKKMAKEKDIDVKEMETIESVLMNDVDIKTMISSLTIKK